MMAAAFGPIYAVTIPMPLVPGDIRHERCRAVLSEDMEALLESYGVPLGKVLDECDPEGLAIVRLYGQRDRLERFLRVHGYLADDLGNYPIEHVA